MILFYQKYSSVTMQKNSPGCEAVENGAAPASLDSRVTRATPLPAPTSNSSSGCSAGVEAMVTPPGSCLTPCRAGVGAGYCWAGAGNSCWAGWMWGRSGQWCSGGPMV